MSGNVMDLNAVSEQDLERTAGLSKEQAKSIVEYRKHNGPFRSWDDLRAIPGYTMQMTDTLKRHAVTIGGKSAAA